jgi:hypothetical protein
MANQAYNSAINLESLVVPVKASTIFTAQENSLFMSGQLIPMINVPAGSASAQVPLLGAVTATEIGSEATPGEDLDAQAVSDTGTTIACKIIAARTVLRDLGMIDPADIGRVLGNAVAKKFDQNVIAALGSLTASSALGTLSLDEIFDQVAAIRGAGDMSQLSGVVSPAAATQLLKVIGTAAYAGGDFQTEALRNGYIGKLAGVNFFMSAHVTGNSVGYIFGQDAARIAVQGTMNLETQRRAAAVGTDLVASIMAGVAVVDATRGIELISA